MVDLILFMQYTTSGSAVSFDSQEHVPLPVPYTGHNPQIVRTHSQVNEIRFQQIEGKLEQMDATLAEIMKRMSLLDERVQPIPTPQKRGQFQESAFTVEPMPPVGRDAGQYCISCPITGDSQEKQESSSASGSTLGNSLTDSNDRLSDK